jgi:lysozyme
MTTVDVALPRLKADEGFRSKAYRDTNGFLTIGYGFNVDAGITQRGAEALLVAQAQELQETLATYRWYAALDAARQSVCLEIGFNQGLHGLLKYPRMIAALTRQDWEEAAKECDVADPKLKPRYERLAQILRTGSV